MPKVILKSNYTKGGKGGYGKNMINYIATRDGAERNIQRYVSYMSERKGAEKFVNHGLFTSGDNPITLSKVMEEVGNHKGNIWMPIISLTREDAVNTGFDHGMAWKDMLSEIAPKIAEFYKIKLDNLCWYGSFHNEGHHPHVHMVVYSKDPNEGFLTKKGIEKFKSQIVKEVFALEMQQVYQRQSMERAEIKEQCREIFEMTLTNAPHISPKFQEKIQALNLELSQQKGKKTYGYLPKRTKKLVDEIVDLLEQNQAVKEAYELWYQTKQEIARSYTDSPMQRLPLSKQVEFRSIKNMVIAEVDHMELSQTKQVNVGQIANGVLHLMAEFEKLFGDELVKEEQSTKIRMSKKQYRKMMEQKQAKGQKMEGMSY